MYIETNQLKKAYKGREVVKGISVRVDRGSVVGLLGPNGAGKTTTFYMIVGLVSPDSGNVKIPKIEKILVDLFFDKKLLVSYQGNEMEGLASAIRIMKESHADALKLMGKSMFH